MASTPLEELRSSEGVALPRTTCACYSCSAAGSQPPDPTEPAASLWTRLGAATGLVQAPQGKRGVPKTYANAPVEKRLRVNLADLFLTNSLSAARSATLLADRGFKIQNCFREESNWLVLVASAIRVGRRSFARAGLISKGCRSPGLRRSRPWRCPSRATQASRTCECRLPTS